MFQLSAAKFKDAVDSSVTTPKERSRRRSVRFAPKSSDLEKENISDKELTSDEGAVVMVTDSEDDVMVTNKESLEEVIEIDDSEAESASLLADIRVIPVYKRNGSVSDSESIDMLSKTPDIQMSDVFSTSSQFLIPGSDAIPPRQPAVTESPRRSRRSLKGKPPSDADSPEKKTRSTKDGNKLRSNSQDSSQSQMSSQSQESNQKSSQIQDGSKKSSQSQEGTKKSSQSQEGSKKSSQSQEGTKKSSQSQEGTKKTRRSSLLDSIMSSEVMPERAPRQTSLPVLAEESQQISPKSLRAVAGRRDGQTDAVEMDADSQAVVVEETPAKEEHDSVPAGDLDLCTKSLFETHVIPERHVIPDSQPEPKMKSPSLVPYSQTQSSGLMDSDISQILAHSESPFEQVNHESLQIYNTFFINNNKIPLFGLM